MYNIKNISTFDELNPIDKMGRICQDNSFDYTYILEGINGHQEVLDLREAILLSLYSIDSVLKNEGGSKYSFYVKDDNSIKYLIESAYNIVIDKSLFLQSIFILDEAKLIYRFTCAKKFQENDSGIKQLRINSWGNEYIREHNLIEKRKTVLEKLRLTAEKYFFENKIIYDRLTQLLLMDISSQVSKEIYDLDEGLNIKLLS